MLFILNSLAVGGSETKIVRVANALARSGVPVQLAYLNPPETALMKIDPAVHVTHLHRRGKYSVKSLRRLRYLIDDETRVVVAVSLYPLLYVVPAVKLTRLAEVRAVGLVNTSEMISRQAFFGPAYAMLLRQCDDIVFGCVGQQSLWVERYSIPRQRSQVIYNGVDHEAYSPMRAGDDGVLLRRQLGIPEDAIVIGSVGRLAPEKNFDLLIPALAKLKAAGRDAYLVLVGMGKERERLETQASAQGVADRLKLPGLLDDVRPALSMMDIFVLPSRAVETFSNAALEAMAMARPVVLSEIGGAAEMVEHGKSGVLFPVGSSDALTDVLVRLHDSREMRRALGKAARDRVVNSFGFLDMVAQYKALLKPH